MEHITKIKLRSERKFESRINGDHKYCFNSKPPPPDPNLGLSSQAMANVAREQLEFNKRVYQEGIPRQERMDKLAADLVNQQMGIANDGRERAGQMWERWRNNFAPMEDQVAEYAKQAGGLDDQQRSIDRFSADYEGQAAQQRAITDRNMMSMGVSPTSGRFQGMARALELANMAQKASGINNARQGAIDRGMALKGQAINIGRGLPALGLSNDQMALAGGQGAAASGMIGNNLLMQRVAGMNQGFNSFSGNMNAAMDQGMAQHQSAVNATNAKNQMTATGVGTAAAMAAAYFSSDRRLKTDIVEVGKLNNGLALYTFRYIDADKYGHGAFVGVMADEVLGVIPDAVITDEDGFYKVDYAKVYGFA